MGLDEARALVESNYSNRTMTSDPTQINLCICLAPSSSSTERTNCSDAKSPTTSELQNISLYGVRNPSRHHTRPPDLYPEQRPYLIVRSDRRVVARFAICGGFHFPSVSISVTPTLQSLQKKAPSRSEFSHLCVLRQGAVDRSASVSYQF